MIPAPLKGCPTEERSVRLQADLVQRVARDPWRPIETLSNLQRSPSPEAVKLIDENGVSDTIPKKLL